ncbi:MAG: hypothetical protein AAB378_00710 [Patescibacteria group bacterium]
MALNIIMFKDRHTKKNLNYREWCTDNKINDLFGIDMGIYGNVEKKIKKSLYGSVNPENSVSFPAELDDLIRLHFLARTRRVTTILEFGVGKSTVVFADALKKNKEEFGGGIANNLRRANPFEVHSIDSGKKWIDRCKQGFPPALLDFVYFHQSEVEMTTFNGRACTMYKKLPNICPDLIYLDGPDQFAVKNDVRGISTRSPDRLPMSADILLFEPFLLPGTLIVVDGRAANARFLKNNLQRTWRYHYFAKEDIHTFELIEEPLGKINAAQLRFCLGR